MLPKSLAREHVAQVNFDERQRDREKGIAQGDAGVRIARGIDDGDRDAVVFGRLNLADQLMLGIALEGDQGMTAGAGECLELGLDIVQTGRTVNLRFAGAEEIQVRAIEQQNSSYLAMSPAPSRRKGPR